MEQKYLEIIVTRKRRGFGGEGGGTQLSRYEPVSSDFAMWVSSQLFAVYLTLDHTSMQKETIPSRLLLQLYRLLKQTILTGLGMQFRW